MKTFIVAFMCAVAIPFMSAVGQITLTDGYVGNFIAPGRSFANRSDTTTSSINIGSPGATSFNFSGLNTHTQQTYTSIAVASTPFASNFPGATHSIKVDTVYQGVAASVYQYLQLSSTGLRNMGNMARATPFPFSTLELRTTVTPFEIVYGLPATYGTTWHTAFSNNTRITLNGQELSNVTTTHDATYRADAYGPMTLPGTLGTHQTLRFRKINFYNGSPVLSYVFVSNTGAVVQIEAVDTLQGNSGTINITRNKTTWNGPIVPLDVRVSDNVPAEFALKQNYPNPFNPSTTITYQVAATGFVSMKVYNMLGQEVSQLVNEVKSPGTYKLNWNAEGMPSGVYFYTMRADGFTATKRLVLLK